MDSEIVIIGAGLAGLVAAIRLRQLGYEPILIDASLPDAGGEVGGFAKFSGAKFSLPPAGMGLLGVAKTEAKLWSAINSVTEILGLDFSAIQKSSDKSNVIPTLREYSSLLLTPDEIDSLIFRLTSILNELNVQLIRGHCDSISANEHSNILTIKQDEATIIVNCKIVFYAGGRLGTESLIKAGVVPTDTKGIDVGVRIEFFENEGLSGLRQYGPDAKFIRDNCRTFCLNMPGEVYRYPFRNISVPGGVVANKLSTKSNVGILYRTPEKIKIISNLIKVGSLIRKEDLELGFRVKGTALGNSTSLLRDIYGEEAVSKLEEFCSYLGQNGLVDWSLEHIVHIPLIDWHWSTFAQEGTFKTTNKSIFCLGDSSGHARGLLQAAVSGWLAAEEYSYAS